MIDIDVLGIGNAIMDVIAPVDDDFLDRESIVKGGMTLIDVNRATAIHTALEAASTTTEIAGGSAANTMVGIAAQGVKSAYLSKVAKDDLGTRFAADMATIGVEFVSPDYTGDEATARCLIAVTPDGERSMSTYLGANTAFGTDDIVADLIRRARVTYMEGYLFDTPQQQAAFVKAAEIATAAGHQVALTLSDNFCVGRHRASFQHLVDNHVDILFANESELLSLYEQTDFDAALSILAQHCKTACVTRSEKGSVIIDGDQQHIIPVVAVDTLVDSTGAGDQYAAGVLAARAKGLSWAEAGYLGSQCAAEVITHYGARPLG